MKNFRKAIAGATLTGAIILTATAANAGIIVSDVAGNPNPCEESNIVTSTVDSVLSSIGVTDPGTVCGIIVSD